MTPTLYSSIDVKTHGVIKTDYGWNFTGWRPGQHGMGWREGAADNRGGCVAEAELMDPQNMLVVGERRPEHAAFGLLGWPFQDTAAGDAATTRVRTAHNDQHNCTFADGHVKGYARMALISPSSKSMWTRAND